MALLSRPPVRAVVAAVSLALLLALSACNGAGDGDTGLVEQATEDGGAEEGGGQAEVRRVPLQVVAGQRGATLAFVPVHIGDAGPFPFALDTGAATSVIDLDLARRLGLEVIEGTQHPVTGIAAQTTSQLVRVPQWRIDDVQLRDSRISALDIPEPPRGQGPAGLLGSDILSEFGTIAVDYEDAVLLLTPRR